MNPWIPIIVGGILYKLSKSNPQPTREDLLEEKKLIKKRQREIQKRLKEFPLEQEESTDE